MGRLAAELKGGEVMSGQRVMSGYFNRLRALLPWTGEVMRCQREQESKLRGLTTR